MCRKIRALLREKQGLSMILVLCVGAVFVALSAALVYAASVLTANANRQLLEQEAYQLATSFSDVLEEELNENSDRPGTFSYFVNRIYMTSAYYGEKPFEQQSLPNSFSWTPDGAADADGADTITVTLVRRPGEDVDKLNLTSNANGGAGQSIVTEGNWQAQLTAWEETYLFTDLQLDVTVTVTKGGESFAYTVTYDRQIHYPVAYYTINGFSGEYQWNGADSFTINGGDTVTVGNDKTYTIVPHFDTSNGVQSTIHYKRGARQGTEQKGS